MSADRDAATFDTLPVEVLYEIFEYLDLRTRLASFRPLSFRFQSIVDNYPDYTMNLKSIAKPDFDSLCQLIDPTRVRSLLISETKQTFDQVKLFLDRFTLNHFAHLRALSLSVKEEKQLHLLTKPLHIRSLTSFSLRIRNADDRRKTTTAQLISSILKRSPLQSLELAIQEGRFERLRWPNPCSIEALQITNTITSTLFYDILQKLPLLNKLSLTAVKLSCPNPSTAPSSYPLRSLTFTQLNTDMNELEILLQPLPSLVHLKMHTLGNYADGRRWETFIQSHLPLLNKFEFDFTEVYNSAQSAAADMNRIRSSFSTPFWLARKKWFVICETNGNRLPNISVYSVPRFTPAFFYRAGRVAMSTSTEIGQKNPLWTNQIRTLHFNFHEYDSTMTLPNEEMERFFCRVKRLELHFASRRPWNWVRLISLLVDLKTVEQIRITGGLLRRSDQQLLADLAELFGQTSRLASIDLDCDFYSRKSSLTASDICSLVPAGLKHLAASIKTIEEIRTLLQRLPHLASANFMFQYTAEWRAMTQWLNADRPASSFHADCMSLCVWLGKPTDEPNEIQVGNKRMKLN